MRNLFLIFGYCYVALFFILCYLFCSWCVRGLFFKYVGTVVFFLFCYRCVRSLFLMCGNCYVFLFCSCCVFWWHVDGQWEQRKVWRNADQATMPSFFLFFGCSFCFFYLFFALSVLLFLLTASCLCALCTTTYMWTKAGFHKPFSKILLFVFLELFNSTFPLNFQREAQVVVLLTCQSFEG